MARSSRKSRNPRSGESPESASQAVRDSAQKIWLAGLGAFERAKTDGPKMFESLVEQGRNLGARAVGAADDALKSLRQADYAGGRWDKLEQVFEERVSRSLHRLGVLTSREVEELSRQVQELNETVRNLVKEAGAPAGGPRRKAAAGRSGAGARRKASARKAGTAKRASRGSRARQA